MSRTTVFLALTVLMTGTAVAAPIPKGVARAKGILILDDCDPGYKGQDEYHDNLTLLDPAGNSTFRLSGFNNCESIGSTRAVAADGGRKCVWAIENVAKRLRRFSLDGRETLEIPGVKGSAIAVDPATGNVWVSAGTGTLGKGHVAVYDDRGREVATYPITSWDIAYDGSAKAFWVVERNLTKVSAETGKVIFSIPVAQWCAVSVDVDRRDGSAWAAVRANGGAETNHLVKFDAKGLELARVELGNRSAIRVSVDPLDGSVWAACGGAVRKYSADGKFQASHAVSALAVQVDPAGGDVWVATPTEIQRMTAEGKVKARLSHAGKTGQVWMAALE
ncbi:NHL repeat-containing protein [Limnoglobus roseus]|uniref:Uncharacterized protein n=1 Tax=Limnoglobus roseus TaxID=2598579 RepID=A0A5C1AK51_9BACT|nr:hypothetical protein [Limnoglobus roseus]QEL19250.1 hypothetical protein PX52LOC_06312 [Limnoglobus roseus]